MERWSSLDELDFEVTDFSADYGAVDDEDAWKKLRMKLFTFGRKAIKQKGRDPFYYRYNRRINYPATAKVHLILNDPSVSRINPDTLSSCNNLYKLSLTFVTTIEHSAFACCENLRHIVVSSALSSISRRAFVGCKSLEFLAHSTDFHVDSADKENDSVSRYLRWRNDMDLNKERFNMWIQLLRLCNWHTLKKAAAVARASPENPVAVRAHPIDLISSFLVENEDCAWHILSFFGKRRGLGDLRKEFFDQRLEHK